MKSKKLVSGISFGIVAVLGTYGFVEMTKRLSTNSLSPKQDLLIPSIVGITVAGITMYKGLSIK